MLPPANRLTGKSSFDEVKLNGTTFQSKSFGLAVRKRGDSKPTRFGFIVSTKLSKSAVERNRARRILRESVRLNLGKITNGFDIAFLAKGILVGAETKNIIPEVESALKNAGVIVGE